jgi:Zn-dependent protease
MSYQPPIFRGGRLSASPGQIVLIAVLVLLALMIYRGSANPSDIFRAARDLAFLFPALIMSLSFHELAHAWVAYLLGDDTAKRQGRLTLDPRAHLDPMGTMMLIITMIIGIGIGWARPVPVNPWRLKAGPRVGMALVGIAGPISNLLIAFVAIQIFKATFNLPISDDVVTLLQTLAFLNVALAVFNMIPIPPLDGFRVLLGILPGRIGNSFAALEPFGPMLLLLLVFMGQGLIGGVIRAVGVPILRAMAA